LFPYSWKSALGKLQTLDLERNPKLTGCVPLSAPTTVFCQGTDMQGTDMQALHKLCVCSNDVAAELRQSAAIKELLPQLMYGGAPYAGMPTYNAMVQDAVDWSSNIGDMTNTNINTGDSASYKYQLNNVDLSLPPYFEIALNVQVQNGTEYVTSIKATGYPQSSHGCNLHEANLAVNLSILPLMLSQLPRLRNFSCKYCCGSKNPTEAILPVRLPEAASTLEEFDLSGASVAGTLPESWGNWTSLSVLDLSNTELQGTLPGSFSGMVSLTHLNFSSSRLTGAVPSKYGEAKLMRTDVVFDFRNSSIYTIIPSSWSYFARGVVYINPDQAHGCLPDNIHVDTGCCLDGSACNAECAVKSPPLCSNISIETTSLRALKDLILKSAAGQHNNFTTWSADIGELHKTELSLHCVPLL
jgi:hypothetical protein